MNNPLKSLHPKPAGQKEEALEKSEEKEAQLVEGELEKLQHQLMDYENMLKRLQADFENFQKQAVKQNFGEKERGKAETIQNLLPVLESLEGLEKELRKENANVHELLKGFELISKQFKDSLEKLGLKEINAVGKKFDHSAHEVLMQKESVNEDEGRVLEVFSKGYFLNEKLLRPAKVAVGKKKEEIENKNEDE